METHLITDKIESQSCLSGQLAVTLVCARDLVAAESGGTSDPYVITRMETPHGKSDKMKSRGTLTYNQHIQRLLIKIII